MSNDWHSKSSYMLFRDEMVRRVLSGQKSETRRLRWMESVNSSPWFDKISSHCLDKERGLVLFYAGGFEPVAAVKLAFHPGQELFVREPWMQATKEKGLIRYKADGAIIDWRTNPPRALSPEEAAEFPINDNVKFISAFRMPGGYTRLRLTVTSASVQRLHEITPAEAENEGAFLDEYRIQTGNLAKAKGIGVTHAQRKKTMETRVVFYKSSDFPDLPLPVARFAALWQSINGTEPTTSWSHNPWLWRIAFEIKSKLP